MMGATIAVDDAAPCDQQRVEWVRRAFGADWESRPSSLRLRDERDADATFLQSLYASTRAAELDQVDWPQEIKDAFIAHQFNAQRQQYRQHYSSAAFLLIEQAGEPIGRFYLHLARAELRLMDVTLLPERRGQGLGTALMQRLLDWGDALHLPVTLHVEPFNPAQRLYLRLGFETLEVRGVYHFMQRLPAGSA
jgi:GNAT superfamily N-acetyltransferase